MSVNVSITTLAVISVDRFFAVVHPLRPGCSARTAVVTMTVVWTLSVLSSLPTAIAFRVIMIPNDDESPAAVSTDGVDVTAAAAAAVATAATAMSGEKPFCFPQFPTVLDVMETSTVYCLYLVAVQYFLPLVIISFAYCRIMHKIWFAKAPGSAMDARDRLMNKNKKKVGRLLLFRALAGTKVQAVNKYYYTLTSDIQNFF